MGVSSNCDDPPIKQCTLFNLKSDPSGRENKYFLFTHFEIDRLTFSRFRCNDPFEHLPFSRINMQYFLGILFVHLAQAFVLLDVPPLRNDEPVLSYQSGNSYYSSVKTNASSSASSPLIDFMKTLYEQERVTPSTSDYNLIRALAPRLGKVECFYTSLESRIIKSISSDERTQTGACVQRNMQSPLGG
jgi:hypothetical protein